MAFDADRPGKLMGWARVRTLLGMPYRRWRALYLRIETRQVLAKLSPQQLKDIGLTAEDVRRYK